MSLLVDTSVWSLAVRRGSPVTLPEVAALTEALSGADIVVTTGIVVQELLQGLRPSAGRAQLTERLLSLPVVAPSTETHVAAADLRNTCRSRGVQLGTVDALIAALSIEHDLTLLTTDQDFAHAARHVPLRMWRR
ncbi:MAG TPA: PIN domain-containing protein [Dermatophilaceae bacterium]|nr:PIN domain-containing protein [Dermatophilaceae bacterium]